LKASGLEVPDMLLACANDAVSREEIVRLARDRAAKLRGGSYDRVVSIGDGVWDVRTAIDLDVPFIGIAAEERADRLRGAGAMIVLADYSDLDAFMIALENATVPRSRSGGS
jgi:phosphoglycolate phosphatase-like HAD superfamily hydrolase